MVNCWSRPSQLTSVIFMIIIGVGDSGASLMRWLGGSWGRDLSSYISMIICNWEFNGIRSTNFSLIQIGKRGKWHIVFSIFTLLLNHLNFTLFLVNIFSTTCKILGNDNTWELWLYFFGFPFLWVSTWKCKHETIL